MEGKTEFRGFVRDNGDVGVRSYLLSLPSVVCANRAAARAAFLIPDAVSVEHPVGCAQIGADKDQTLRVLVGIGSHPNVHGTMVVGLGCEGVPAIQVCEGIRLQRRCADMVNIQDVGGTEQAAERAAHYLNNLAELEEMRNPVSIDRLLLGVAAIEGLESSGRAVLEAFQKRGGRVIEACADNRVPRLPYGVRMPRQVKSAYMEVSTGNSEILTGLVAAGAHIILAQADARNAGGHPIAPVARIGYDERLREALLDDMDAMIDERTPNEWVDWILDIASGALTMSETLRLDTFSIERIGPTL